ncbi:MAG TPA: hypothetical protein VJT71_16480 [Pyrinomonadaceae bacterium]|nr:hypothetical protein [Pyrinomonadaceae bacterium]
MLLQNKITSDLKRAKDSESDHEYDYSTLIEKQVIRAVKAGARSFSEVCLASNGAFPTDVFATIQRLELSDKILVADRLVKHEQSNYEWPEPSPVDYEWRFTRKTAETLATTSMEFGHRILCIGTPTVFRNLILRGADAHLLDRNPLIADAFRRLPKERIHIADISESHRFSNLGGFDVVVMDPPWYPTYVNYWVSIASSILVSNGTIILTLFPELTRPDARLQRAMLLSNLDQFGTYEVIQQNISYETPLFERETLSAVGVPALPVWRTADLVILQIRPSRSSLFAAPAPNEFQWDRFLFGTQVVAVRKTSEESRPISVSSPYEDLSYLLRSVSTRDPVRSTIDLWTSRNRVAKVAGQRRISEFLRILESGIPCREAISHISTNSEEQTALETIVALIGW